MTDTLPNVENDALPMGPPIPDHDHPHIHRSMLGTETFYMFTTMISLALLVNILILLAVIAGRI